MWLSAVFDWACSTKCTCYRARQIRVLGSHKIALSRIWTRGPICLQAKPTFAIGKVLQHRSFAVRAGSIRSPVPPRRAGASRRKAMPNMGTEIAARCAYWHQETCWTYIWARSKPWPSSSNLKMWRCIWRHHGHEPEIFDDLPFCQNPTFKDPPTDEQGWTELAGLPAFIIHTENRDGPKILLRKNKQSWLCCWSHRRPAVRRDGSVFARNQWCVIAHSTASVKALPVFGRACHRKLRHLQTAENQVETSMDRRQVWFEWKPRTKSRRIKLTGINTLCLSKTVNCLHSEMSQWY